MALRDPRFLERLRRLGIIEGTSTLVLFGIAMPLKYFAGFPLAVTIVGSLHGFLFVALVLMFAIAVWRVPLPLWMAVVGVLAAILPFGPFLFDPRLHRLADADASA